MNYHDRYNRSAKGRARRRQYNLKRIRVLGDRVQAPDMQTRELMARLRDERKAACDA